MSTLGQNKMYRLYGAEELSVKLRLLREKIGQEALDSALLAGAEIIAVEARRRAPIRTGYLRSSIQASTTSSGQLYGEAQIDVGAYYGPFVELGTSRMAARPYLRPAVLAKKNEAALRVRDELAQFIIEVSH